MIVGGLRTADLTVSASRDSASEYRPATIRTRREHPCASYHPVYRRRAPTKHAFDL